MADISIKFRLREDESIHNDFWIEDVGIYETTDTLLVYNPRNTVVFSGTIGDVDSESEAINLSTDVDGNPLAGTWRFVVDGTTYSFAYTNLDFTAVVRQTPDGYSSTFLSTDVSDYTGWTVESRSHDVLVPSGDMDDEDGGSTDVYIPANIYSGEYISTLEVEVSREIVSASPNTGGILTVYDSDLDEESINVYKIAENTVFEQVQTYFEEYQDNLSTAPKTALDKQSSLFKIGNAIHLFSKALRGGDTQEMYNQLLIVQETLNPDYLDETPEVEEIVPYEFTEIDHSHDNKTTILDLFTIVDGDLYFDGDIIGTETGKVKVNVGDAAEYLEGKTDNVTIEISSSHLRVKPSYIEGLAGTGLTYSGGKFNVTSGSDDDDDDFLGEGITEWDSSITYSVDDWVYITDTGVDYIFKCVLGNTNVDPVTDDGEYWSQVTLSEGSHTQNTDVKLGNIYVELFTSEITDGALTNGGSDTQWYNYNHIRITKNDSTSSCFAIRGESSEDIDSIDLQNQDITFVYNAATPFAILDAEEEDEDEESGDITFNNCGNEIQFTEVGQWVRYRYNVDTGRMDFVATSIPLETILPSFGGIGLDALSAVEGEIDDDDVVFSYDNTTGAFTLDKDLSKYDNTVADFLASSSFNTAFDVRFALSEIGNLARKRHGDLSNLLGNGAYHVSTAEIATWNAKQSASVGTASRALVSDGSGNISVSAITSTEIGYLDDCTSNIQAQLNALSGAAAKTYLVSLISAASLDLRLAGSQVKPSGWTLSSTGGGADLVITHDLGVLPVSVSVYSTDGGTGVSTWMQGALGYNTLQSNSGNTAITLTSFCTELTAVHIKLSF